MKITLNIITVPDEAGYCHQIRSFLEQYRERFPGINYLHLEITENSGELDQQPVYYSSDGQMLKITVFKGTGGAELMTDLRDIFDHAVEEHLTSHLPDYLSLYEH